MKLNLPQSNNVTLSNEPHHKETSSAKYVLLVANILAKCGLDKSYTSQ